jgi:hypothetical protein
LREVTVFLESLLNGESEQLVRTVIEAAKAGDMAAAKLCLDRLLPPLKSRPIKFALPELHTTSDALTALASIAEGISNGQLLPEEAEALTANVSAFIKVCELNTHEERLNSLESWRNESRAATHYDA